MKKSEATENGNLNEYSKFNFLSKALALTENSLVNLNDF